MKKYRIIDNTIGWLVFLVAAVTYLLTIEPTASFWDCPEFVAQGFKGEIGHPPGNPIFILTARLAACFAGGDVTLVARCVNAMSAIFSALTILLLFWTVTHLVRRLIVEDGHEDEMTLWQYVVVMGSGIVGALAYTWSDTFWYSAVEAEVYAFSSFCTALVFWLALKWEEQADDPASDRWLLLIAYVFGVSLGVHLLNLLCIPAIALVFYYRKWKHTTVKGSFITLGISFVVIVLILYGLEPGFIKWAQYFELLAVNNMGLHYNSGVIIYALLLLAALVWNLWLLHGKNNDMAVKLSFLIAMAMSGMFFIGDSLLVPIVLIACLAAVLFAVIKSVPRRLMYNITASVLLIFIGFASYGVILIRSSANTPLDENSPNNVFALQKYLSREQYGETPLLYGRTVKSEVLYQSDHEGTMHPVVNEGPEQYTQAVKTDPSQPDRYVSMGPKKKYVYVGAQNMLFPRIHSEAHNDMYYEWLGKGKNNRGRSVRAATAVNEDGSEISEYTKNLFVPTMGENLSFFFSYQVNYMYWRYFMWNFAGRQNDIQGMGEITQGNWISGIPIIDNPRLGDQSLLPDDLGGGNKGHNVFYMLPLLLGIIGLLWQAYRGQRGIEQFWVTFFLFFMTGLAIVLYLNQPPSQPRERDYAYAGSFYAFAIWIGMGVAGLWAMARRAMASVKSRESVAAVAAAALGIIVPLQMVSQTWDDHDRSGRYAARDFGMNYLASVDKDAIIFTNGDNDTFPLWYAQEVEGYRTDVRVCNLSYLSTDWYIAQMQRAAYDSRPLPMQAGADTFAYDERQYNYLYEPDDMAVPVSTMLNDLYNYVKTRNPYKVSMIEHSNVFIPVDADAAISAGVVPEKMRSAVLEAIPFDLTQLGSGFTSSQVMSLDIINSSIEREQWKRPCYFAMTVPSSYYLGLEKHMLCTGMAYQVAPVNGLSPATGDIGSNTEKMYRNIKEEFRWGGIDTAPAGSLYLDETIRRMVTTTRMTMLNLAADLAAEGDNTKALEILDLSLEKLPVAAAPLGLHMGMEYAVQYDSIASRTGNKEVRLKAVKMVRDEVLRYAQYVRYYQSLSSGPYGLYNRLANTDLYIDQRYFPSLLEYYAELDPEGTEKLLDEVADLGVDLNRIFRQE